MIAPSFGPCAPLALLLMTGMLDGIALARNDRSRERSSAQPNRASRNAHGAKRQAVSAVLCGAFALAAVDAGAAAPSSDATEVRAGAQWVAGYASPREEDSFAAPADAGPTAAPSANEPFGPRQHLKLAWADVGHVISAPTRWDRSEWGKAGIAAGGLVLVAAFVDAPFREAVDGEYDENPDDLLGAIEPFGTHRYTNPLLAGFWLTGAIRGDSRAREVAFDGVVASFIADRLITSNLKRATGRARPYQELGADEFNPFDGDRSFPSGHTTHAFAIAAVIATHYDDTPWVPVVSYGVAGLVGAERIAHDKHWLSDVLAGALIGTLVGREVVDFNRERRGTWRPRAYGSGQSIVLAWEW